MKDKCIEELSKAAGRTLNSSEIKNIEDTIKQAQRRLATEDTEAYLSMSQDQRLAAAAKIAGDDLIADAAKKRQRVAATIKINDQLTNYFKEQESKYGFGPLNSLERVLVPITDGKSNFQSVATRSSAIRKQYASRLLQVFELTNPKILGLFTDADGIRAFTYELYGEDSSNLISVNFGIGKGKPISKEVSSLAKQAAEQWTKVTEEMRKRFNNAGGEIGYLDDWKFTQKHDQSRIAKAGKEFWVNYILPKLKRERYRNEDGSVYSDVQMVDMLNKIWLTIATGGANKREPGKMTGKGMLANQNAEERSLHFKDAGSYLEYQSKFGTEDVYTTMIKHLSSISDDIAMVETMSPNPDLMFKYLLDKGIQDEKIKYQNDPNMQQKISEKAVDLQNQYDFVSGKMNPIVNKTRAQVFDTFQSWLSSVFLGSSFITSITDNATMRLTAGYNNISHLKLFMNQMRTLNPLNREELSQARRAGLSLQTYMNEINRWGVDNLSSNAVNKLGGALIRGSFLNAATEARRRAWGVTMYSAIGEKVESYKDLSSVPEYDQKLLRSKGISDEDFAVWKLAKLDDWGMGNTTMLTPENIFSIPDQSLSHLGNPERLRNEAAMKLIGMVDEETNIAIIEPDAKQRAKIKSGMQRGSWKGSLWQSMTIFKSFPLALIDKHWRRAMGNDTKMGTAWYLAKLMAYTTIFGAAAQQASAISNGQDPQDMTDTKFWLASLLKGGSLGIYGDFLFNPTTKMGNTPLAVLGGPMASWLESLDQLTRQNIMKYFKGEKTDFGADFVKFLKMNTPFQNLWYTKAALDRLFFSQLQEMASPGYNRRSEARAKKEYGTTYYWHLGETEPSRAPDLDKAIGDK